MHATVKVVMLEDVVVLGEDLVHLLHFRVEVLVQFLAHADLLLFSPGIKGEHGVLM